MAARHLGLEGFGIFTLVLSLYTMFELAVCFGFDNIIVREVALRHTNAKIYFTHGALIGAAASMMGGFLLVVLGNVMHYPSQIKASIGLVSLLLFPSFLYYLLENIFIGLERAKYILLSALGRDTMLIILGIVVLGRQGGINAVILVMLWARIFGFICLLCFAKLHKLELLSRLDFIFLDKMVRLLPTFWWIAVSSCLFLELDTVILSKVLPFSELGLYNLAKRIFRVANIFYFSFSMASYPKIAQCWGGPKDDLITIYRRYLWMMFVLCLSLVFLALFLSGFFIHVFFGDQYMPAMRYLKVLVWSSIPLGISLLLSRFLIAAHRQNKD
ncbi:MAG: oligosaccharide flippase family protein, partial [Candidatus Omnitrophica bacterium]|nr:oligosaccharide flippase family protein [Candidatus Omnitrophota bacterium]